LKLKREIERCLRIAGSTTALLIFIQVFVRDVVFREFARPDSALIGIGSVLDALHYFGFERVPFLEQFVHAL
jgi:hypothetical protein